MVGANIDLKGLQFGAIGAVADITGNKIVEPIFKSDNSEIKIQALAMETTLMP